MREICNNEQLLTLFSGENSLLDGQIERIEIFAVSASTCVNVAFQMRPSSNYSKVQFKFIGCSSYCFAYSDDHYFYNVERLKFFRNEDGSFYVSFDPVDDAEIISDEDQDFVHCKDVFAYASRTDPPV